MIRAILWAQFRSMRFGRGSGFFIVAAAIWYGLWTFGGCIAGVTAAEASIGDLRRYLPLALMGVCLYWQIIPIISASMGASLDLRKLLAFPIPHGKLFFIEVLLRFTTGIEPMLILIGGGVGLLANPAVGGWVAATRLVAAFAVFVAFNLLLGSGMRSILERLLTRRHVREALAFFMAMIWVAPRFLAMTGIRPRWLGPVLDSMSAVGLPWTAAAHASLSLAGQSGLLAAVSLGMWTAFGAWFGRSQFERNLRYDPQAAQSTPASAAARGSGLLERFYRLPSRLWRDPMGGLIEKELRSLARTPRFRMVFVMGFTFGIMLWLPMMMGRGSHPTMSRYFLVIVSMYALTLLGGVTYWNCFGFDRAAALFYFAAPLRLAQVLVAKNIAALIFIYVEVGVLSVITAALRMGIGAAQIVEAMVVTGIAAAYMMALGNAASVRYPRALDPERVSQGSGGGFQGFLFLLYPLVLLPLALAYLARYAFDSNTAFVLVLGLAAGIAAVFYKISLDSAVGAAAAGRETMLAALTKNEGPVVAG